MNARTICPIASAFYLARGRHARAQGARRRRDKELGEEFELRAFTHEHPAGEHFQVCTDDVVEKTYRITAHTLRA
jgi:hypothetical protein